MVGKERKVQAQEIVAGTRININTMHMYNIRTYLHTKSRIDWYILQGGNLPSPSVPTRSSLTAACIQALCHSYTTALKARRVAHDRVGILSNR